MKKQLFVSILVIVGLLILAVGFLTGYLYQSLIGLGPQNQAMSKTIKSLSSSVITSVIAIGKIDKVSNNTITLIQNNEAIGITVDSATQVLNSKADEKKSQWTPGALSVGDIVMVRVKLMPDGTIHGFSIQALYGADNATQP